MHGNAGECQYSTGGNIRKKLADTVEWYDIYAPTCEACKEIYGARTPPEEPPCDICRPKYLKENEDAINIFFLVRTQSIVGADGYPIDIIHQAIHEAMKLYKIKNKKGCFEKVLRMSQIWFKKMEEK